MISNRRGFFIRVISVSRKLINLSCILSKNCVKSSISEVLTFFLGLAPFFFFHLPENLSKRPQICILSENRLPGCLSFLYFSSYSRRARTGETFKRFTSQSTLFSPKDKYAGKIHNMPLNSPRKSLLMNVRNTFFFSFFFFLVFF